MTVVQLKQLLREHNLSVAGKKADLIERAETIVDYTSMTVVQLKQVLRDHGLPVSGKKADLIERIQQKEKSIQEEQKILEEKKEYIENKVTSPKKNISLKFRAEYEPDVDTFRARCEKANIELKKFKEVEVNCEMEAEFVIASELLLSIVKIIKKIPNSHVMLQSLNYKEDYTGDRDNVIAGYFGF